MTFSERGLDTARVWMPVLLAFGLSAVLCGCVPGEGAHLAVTALELDGAARSEVVPTIAPLRDMVWSGGRLVGIAGQEIVSMLPGAKGEVGPYEIWKLPADVQARPLIAADDEGVLLIDSVRLCMYRLRLDRPLKIESFVLPGELEGAHIVDLEWDLQRRLIWLVDRGRHRILGLRANSADGEAEIVQEFGGKGRSGLRFNVPLDVAVDSLGMLWILDSLNRRVLRVDATTPRILEVIGGDGPSSRRLLPRPRAICVDSEDRLWVYDDARGGLLEFEPKASWTNEAEPSVLLPSAVAHMVASRDAIWVGQPLNSRVLRVVPR